MDLQNIRRDGAWRRATAFCRSSRPTLALCAGGKSLFVIKSGEFHRAAVPGWRAAAGVRIRIVAPYHCERLDLALRLVRRVAPDNACLPDFYGGGASRPHVE